MPTRGREVKHQRLRVGESEDNNIRDGQPSARKGTQMRTGSHDTNGNLSEHIESSNRHVLAHTAKSIVTSDRSHHAGMVRNRTAPKSELNNVTALNHTPSRNECTANSPSFQSQTPSSSLSKVSAVNQSGRWDVGIVPHSATTNQPVLGSTSSRQGIASYRHYQHAPSTPSAWNQNTRSSLVQPGQETSYLEWDEDSTSALSKVKRSLRLGQNKDKPTPSLAKPPRHIRALQKVENATLPVISTRLSTSSQPKYSYSQPSTVHSLSAGSDHMSNTSTQSDYPARRTKQEQTFDPDLNVSKLSSRRLMQPFAYDRPQTDTSTIKHRRQPRSEGLAVHSTAAQRASRYKDRSAIRDAHNSQTSPSISQTYESINRLNSRHSPSATTSPTSLRHVDYRHDFDSDEPEGYPASEATPVSPMSIASATTNRTATTTTSSASRPRRLKALMQTLRERGSKKDLKR